MLLVFALIALSTATAASVVIYQRTAERRFLQLQHGQTLGLLPEGQEEERTTERTLSTLRIGDVVSQGEQDWVIIGTCDYREERDRWRLHLLDAGAEQIWLETQHENDHDGLFLSRADDIPIFGTLQDAITFRGETFRLDRRGDARVDVDGDVGERAVERLRYTRYEGPGSARLLIEESDGKRRAYIGYRTPASILDLLPGQRTTL